MTIKRGLAMACALLSSGVAPAAPKIEYVELQPYTHHVVYIPPAMGTKFIFEFALDETPKDNFPPFSSLITNPIFEKKRAEGLNSFIAYTPPTAPEGTRGNLFFNVAGYEITVELIATKDYTKHVSDVYFKLSGEKREALIQEAVAQRIKGFEQEYQQRRAALDTEADRKALARVGELALVKPDAKRVKEEANKVLKNGDNVTVYVDEQWTIGRYTVIPFQVEIDSRSGGASLHTARLFAKNRANGQLRALEAVSSLPARVEPSAETKGVITLMSELLNSGESLQLAVQVEDVTVEVEW